MIYMFFQNYFNHSNSSVSIYCIDNNTSKYYKCVISLDNLKRLTVNKIII